VNPDTGAIAHFEWDEDAEQAGYTVKLHEDQLEMVAPMNRHDRRQWAAQERARIKRNKVSK